MNKIESETGKLPFFVTGIRGKLGNRVYYMRNGKIRSRRHVMPYNPRSVRQRERRSRFADAVKEWRGLDADARTPWNRRARGMKMSGYSLFMRESMSRTAGAGVPSPRHARLCLAFRFHMPAPCGGLRACHMPFPSTPSTPSREAMSLPSPPPSLPPRGGGENPPRLRVSA